MIVYLARESARKGWYRWPRRIAVNLCLGSHNAVTYSMAEVPSRRFVSSAALRFEIVEATGGIQEFGFNVVSGGVLPPDPAAQPSAWTLPTGWSSNTAPPPNQEDGFGPVRC